LEFYQAYADYVEMMDVVEALVGNAAAAVRAALSSIERPEGAAAFEPVLEAGGFPRIEWVPALSRALGVPDALALDITALRTAATRKGVHGVEKLSRPKLLDELFQGHVESAIERPTF